MVVFSSFFACLMSLLFIGYSSLVTMTWLIGTQVTLLYKLGEYNSPYIFKCYNKKMVTY
jgi:hypothetical protein